MQWQRFSNPTTDLQKRNEETSAAEVAAFIEEKPDKYFVYIKDLTGGRGVATTWMGDKLGDVTFGRAYKSNMGDERVSIHMRGINGLTYSGTYYRGAGDYARIRKIRR